MSSTSGSCVASFRGIRVRSTSQPIVAYPTDRGSSRSADRVAVRRECVIGFARLIRLSTPACDAPTRAGGRCTSPGCRSASGRTPSPSARGKTASRPSATHALRLATLGYFRNHCSLRRGSIGTSARSLKPTLFSYGSSFSSAPQFVEDLDGLLARLEAVEPGEVGAGHGVHRAVGREMSMTGSPWRWPISKSALSCAGVTFSTPVPKSKSTGRRR